MPIDIKHGFWTVSIWERDVTARVETPYGQTAHVDSFGISCREDSSQGPGNVPIDVAIFMLRMYKAIQIPGCYDKLWRRYHGKV